jgi:nitroreductase
MSSVPVEDSSFVGPNDDHVWGEEDHEDKAGGDRGIDQEDDHHLPLPGHGEGSDADSLPHLFQNLILTRRTRSRFAPPLAQHPGSEPWVGALDRAVRCGYAAPNHKRTEPFTFRRLIAPSIKTEQLAELAYHVQMRKHELLRQQKLQRRTNTSTSSNHDADDSTQDEHLLLLDTKSARRKQDKWSQIPAWLVATVRSPSVLEQLSHLTGSPANASLAASPLASESASRLTPDAGLSPSTLGMYDPLEYQPPGTIRELEDYASCCAAVQNVLLSLHSEGIASKWATGDVVQTPAFRSLLELPDDERVVALIQVGWPPEAAAASAPSVSSHPSSLDSRWTSNAYTASSMGESPSLPRPRRHHRALKGDVLIDL